MPLVDTHCHIHSADYPLAALPALERAHAAGVERLICVGTDAGDSELAVEFAGLHGGVYASIAIHPHEATLGLTEFHRLEKLAPEPSVVAVGECGLDYYYENSLREHQRDMLRMHLQLAVSHNLPLIFHVREAFDDFWPIFDEFSGIRGVLHSFTDSRQNMEEAVSRGLYIGVNGISTFTKDSEQQTMFSAIPVKNLLLETDAPFLTPKPLRGTVNEPAFVTHVAQFHADLHTLTLEELSVATTQNATTLFNLN